MSKEESLSIANPHPKDLSGIQKVAAAISGIGVLILFLAFFGVKLDNALFLSVSILLMLVGTVLFTYSKYANLPAGIKNNGVWFDSLSNRGAWAWVIGIILTGFYVLLYWFPSVLGLGTGVDGTNEGLVALFDPLSYFLNGKPSGQWFVYGTLYTVAILFLGLKFIVKYWHNTYQKVRTVVVMISQFFLAYFIPEILVAMNYNGVKDESLGYEVWYDADIKNVWPLNYDFFYDWNLTAMQSEATAPVGMTYLWVGMLMFLIGTPIITYFVGKRWYCSWVCGCGGLAETAGDNFRQLSSKKLSSWKLERWMIHGVMILVFIMTFATLYGHFAQTDKFLGLSIYTFFQQPYGFIIGAAFSGIVGVGFYPLLGNRVWCRFGCPMAGYMGIIQRFKSRFRITTNGGQCISCGNCSTYCEQGIDVRWYAQRGQNIVRASCVGCGVCSAVCPRGVLKLENGPEAGRFKDDMPIIIGNDGIKLAKTA